MKKHSVTYLMLFNVSSRRKLESLRCQQKPLSRSRSFRAPFITRKRRRNSAATSNPKCFSRFSCERNSEAHHIFCRSGCNWHVSLIKASIVKLQAIPPPNSVNIYSASIFRPVCPPYERHSAKLSICFCYFCALPGLQWEWPRGWGATEIPNKHFALRLWFKRKDSLWANNYRGCHWWMRPEQLFTLLAFDNKLSSEIVCLLWWSKQHPTLFRNAWKLAERFCLSNPVGWTRYWLSSTHRRTSNVVKLKDHDNICRFLIEFTFTHFVVLTTASWKFCFKENCRF